MRKKLQRQSFADILQNRSSKKFRKFHRKTAVLESLFNKVAGLKTCNFIKKRLQHRCFPAKFEKFSRIPLATLVATFETKHRLQLLFYYMLE